MNSKLLLPAAAALFAALPPTIFAQAAPAAVTVNGQPISRAAIDQRLWRLYGAGAVDQMIQEELIRQAAAKNKVSADPEEVERRLKTLRSQFQDDAAFQAGLQKAGSSLEDMKARIADQVLREELVTKALGLKVTDAEVKDYFDANKDKLASPETVHLRHILVATEPQAKDLLAALKAGADFGKLADQLSIDAGSNRKGGDLGFVPRGIIIPELDKAAFALKPGEVSEILRTNLGYHVLKVDEIKPGEPANFKKIKDELKKSLLAGRISAAWPGYLKSLSDSAKIEAAATEAPAPAAVVPVTPSGPAPAANAKP